MILRLDEAQVKASPFQKSWCKIGAWFYVECNIGSEIILDAPIKLLGDVGHVESHFFLFGDSVSVGAR
jgi:hypothetical protein